MISECAIAQDPPVRLEQLVEAHPRGFLERPIPACGITRRSSKNGPATVPAREEATHKLLLHLVFLHCVFHFFVHFDRDDVDFIFRGVGMDLESDVVSFVAF